MKRTNPSFQVLSFLVLATFLTFILFLGIAQEAENYENRLKGDAGDPGDVSSSKSALFVFYGVVYILIARCREAGLRSVCLEEDPDR